MNQKVDSRNFQLYIQDYARFWAIGESATTGEILSHSVHLTGLLERDLPEFVEAFKKAHDPVNFGDAQTALIELVTDTLKSTVKLVDKYYKV